MNLKYILAKRMKPESQVYILFEFINTMFQKKDKTIGTEDR